ncbi:hypothetical protein GG851_04545 [Bordetella petrii]|nr:hypothetical protein [Bordetella petrii]
MNTYNFRESGNEKTGPSGRDAVELHPCSVTHDDHVLRRLSCLLAINAALQVDLHGRVNAEWAGARRVSSPIPPIALRHGG